MNPKIVYFGSPTTPVWPLLVLLPNFAIWHRTWHGHGANMIDDVASLACQFFPKQKWKLCLNFSKKAHKCVTPYFFWKNLLFIFLWHGWETWPTAISRLFFFIFKNDIDTMMWHNYHIINFFFFFQVAASTTWESKEKTSEPL